MNSRLIIEQKPLLTPLKGFRCFEPVFQRGKKFFQPNILTVVAFRTLNSPSVRSDSEELPEKVKPRKVQPRATSFGVTVPKRTAKRAVDRNKLKRRTRAILSQTWKSDPELSELFESVIVVWRGEKNVVQTRFDQLTATVLDTLRQARMKVPKNRRLSSNTL